MALCVQICKWRVHWPLRGAHAEWRLPLCLPHLFLDQLYFSSSLHFYLFNIRVIWLVRLLAFLGFSLYFMILLRGTQHWELPLYGPQVLISKLSLNIIKCSWVNTASSILTKRELLSSLMFQLEPSAGKQRVQFARVEKVKQEAISLSCGAGHIGNRAHSLIVEERQVGSTCLFG